MRRSETGTHLEQRRDGTCIVANAVFVMPRPAHDDDVCEKCGCVPVTVGGRFRCLRCAMRGVD